MTHISSLSAVSREREGAEPVLRLRREKLLTRIFQNAAGRYANTLTSATFLGRAKPGYIGGLIELSSSRLYDVWSGLGGLLRTGVPAAREEQDGNEFFSALANGPVALRKFLEGMTGIATGEAVLLAAR